MRTLVALITAPLRAFRLASLHAGVHRIHLHTSARIIVRKWPPDCHHCLNSEYDLDCCCSASLIKIEHAVVETRMYKRCLWVKRNKTRPGARTSRGRQWATHTIGESVTHTSFLYFFSSCGRLSLKVGVITSSSMLKGLSTRSFHSKYANDSLLLTEIVTKN